MTGHDILVRPVDFEESLARRPLRKVVNSAACGTSHTNDYSILCFTRYSMFSIAVLLHLGYSVLPSML